jgi:hypothetical protein
MAISRPEAVVNGIVGAAQGMIARSVLQRDSSRRP